MSIAVKVFFANFSMAQFAGKLLIIRSLIIDVKCYPYVNVYVYSLMLACFPGDANCDDMLIPAPLFQFSL